MAVHHQKWTTLMEMAFCTTAVGIYIACLVTLRYVCPCNLCTQIWRSIAPRTVGVRWWQRAWQKTKVEHSDANLCTQIGMSRVASYSRCTIPIMHNTVHHPKGRTLSLTAFNTPAERIYTAVWLTSSYDCHSLYTQTGWWCGSSYSMGTIPIMRIALHHHKRTTHMQMSFWYNRGRDLYRLLIYVDIRMSAQPLYTNWDISWSLVQ